MFLVYIQYTLENTEGAITNGQSRETGNIGYTRQANQNTTQLRHMVGQHAGDRYS